MKANILPVMTVLSADETAMTPDLRIFEVSDYSLFQYGLVRGDRIFVSNYGKPKFIELAVYFFDGIYRAGIPQWGDSAWLNRAARFITASKVEFVIPFASGAKLFRIGRIIRSVIGPIHHGEQPLPLAND